MENFLFCFLLFISIGTIDSFGQTGKNNVEILGDTLSANAYSYFNSNKLDSAAITYIEASKKYFQVESWDKYVSSLSNIATVYYYDKKYTEFNTFVLKAFDESKKHLKPSQKNRIYALANLNTYYYNIGNFSKSVEISEEASVLYLKNKASKLDLIKSYSNLGNAYRNLGDHQKAFEYFRKALKTQQDTLPNLPNTAQIYQSLGKTFKSIQQLDSTIFYYEKAKVFFDPVKLDNPLIRRKINNYLILAELWSKKQTHQKAKAYINQALQLSPNEFYQVQVQETLGKMAVNKNNYQEAIKAFLEGQRIADQNNKRNTPPLKARRLIELAKAYSLSENYENTIATYQDALKTLAPDFENDNFQENPQADQLLDKPDALTILEGKAKTLQKLYALKKDKNYLNASFDTYKIATDLIQDIRQGFLNIESKNALSEKTVSIYEGAIQSALILFRETKDNKYKHTAFTLAESNKALLLLESLNEQTAKGFAGIPDSLLEKEKDLKLNLAFLKNTLLENKGKGSPTKNLDDQIFDTQQKLDQLTNNFEKNYPRYFELKYQNDPIKVKAIQDELAKSKSTLLEYFVGEEAIFLFIISANELDIQTIENPEQVFTAINQIRPILSNSPGSMDSKIEFNQFTSAAHSLYKMLLDPVMSKTSNTSNLTIIPDYLLNYIPFDLLLTKAADQNKPGYSPSNLEYLFEKNTINYHYSATLLYKSQQRNKKVFEHNFIGFAPIFKEGTDITSRACTADELYSLKCSGEEVSKINNLFNGLSLEGKAASRSNFEKEASAYRIIHMATHACVDEDDSNFNKIFLTDDFLSNYDLYNLHLNADLAVLSACNTGSGELVKGEGVMSLARGFINAGCSSTLMSMWSVDDCTTSDIMIRFYEGIKSGLKKDEALRIAKIGYMESANKSKMHPYYWAAFVPFGDMEAMKIGEKSNWLLYLIPSLFLLVILFFFIRNKSNN